MADQDSVIAIGIALSGPLSDLAADQVEAAAAAHVGMQARSLGIPGEIQVTVHTDDADASSPAAVRISVHGAPLDYPRLLDEQLLTWCGHRRDPAAQGKSRLPTWQDELAAGEDAAVLAVAELAAYATAANPRALLGPAQVAAWLRAGAPIAGIESAIDEILATMLGMRLSIDRDRIAGLFEVAANSAVPDPVESVIAQVRPEAIEVRVATTYLEEITTTGFDAGPDTFPIVRDSLYAELGLRLPRLLLIPDGGLPPRCFTVRVNDVTSPPFVGVPPGMRFVSASAEQAASFAPTGAACAALSPLMGLEGAYLPTAMAAAAERYGYSTWTSLSHLALAIAETARAQAHALVDHNVVASELRLFEILQPSLAVAAKSVLPMGRLTRLLRSLLAERVPIRDLRGLLQALVDVDADGRLPASDDELLAMARLALGPLITQQTMMGNRVLAYVLEPNIEADLLATGEVAAAARRSLLDSLDKQMASRTWTWNLPALVTRGAIRRAVREAIADAWPHLTVLGYEELLPSTNVQPVARL